MRNPFPILPIILVSVSLIHADTSYTLKKLRPLSQAEEQGTPFLRLEPESTAITSRNEYNDPRMWGRLFRELTLGALETGVAVADFDMDGRLDIYSVSKNGPCSLYLQTVDYKFVDIARVAGVAADEMINGKAGAAAVDINQDGWMDIYLCRYDAPNLLFVNNGDATFEERAAEYGLDINDASVHASFADYDRDGDLDCYIVTNILDFSVSPQGSRDYLMENLGDGQFLDVTARSGIWGKTQGHTAIWFDANQDGWPDVYVANDFETPDRFYLNEGNGSFVDVVDERLQHVTYFSMGADSGDLNNDGLVDYFVADMRDRTRQEYVAGMEEMGRGLWDMERVADLIPQYMWNALYLNAGNDRYKEIAHMAGMEATGWTWATRMGDFDCDGLIDVMFTTGMIRNFIDADLIDKQNVARTLQARAAVWKNAPPRNETNMMFRNNGNLTFEDVSKEWGIDHDGISFGCVTADMDGDGDLDLVYSNYNEPPSIVRNDFTSGNRFVVELEGDAPNRRGVGAEITIETQSGKQVRQLYGERGIVSSEPVLAYFGLGDEEEVSQLTVRWPRGQMSVLEDLPAGHRVVINEPAIDNPVLNPAVVATARNPDALFSESAQQHGLEFESDLRNVDELSRQRLLPRRLNGQGPALAASDVDGDGYIDIFVSGPAGQAGVLYLGTSSGVYKKSSSQAWANEAEADDVAAIFFDANGDQVPDLYVAASGVKPERGDALLVDRLYLNDGNGSFTLAGSALPAEGEATGAVAAADFDGDGDMDLFVGGRFVPGKWPETPRSFLFRNDGGTFTDVTEAWAPGLKDVGMVTDAAFSDIDADGKVDLLLAIEWGPITCFANDGKSFQDRSSALGLAPYKGWWSAVAVEDLNGDGRLDIVAGNVGLNTKYHASTEEPTVVLVGDFGGQGRNHIVEAQYDSGRLCPVRGRSKLAYAFPWLPNKFATYQDYSRASVDEIFTVEQLGRTRRLEATELGSGVFFQNADGTFTFERLGSEAQAAPVHAISISDFDGDGNLDVFCAGNNFGAEPSTGRFDGGLGILLAGDGKGSFEPMWPNQSGISVPGETRALAILPSKNGKPGLLVARTSGPLYFFTPVE
ncbi:VCBS repeat-containing protein [Pelagicoccus sp. SDUM812002]|uniref:VCBS repeat-containing protein n=1 Tax=Pelagicoccus sp. SDUM812002 TaxID=3041266 RepID=UPI00280CAA08|nr:VCBS repeat-containing protein [Pelagicoccus sp. SDUM812002]MDQ8186498.1 VCBS repeat-containing protein [Pelagicoccus sp. SDUM812002]